MATIAFKAEGEAILVIGKAGMHLGRSAYLMELLGRDEGAPPPVDLRAEKANGDFVRTLISDRRITACHDVSDGGLAIALVEMALAGGMGVAINLATSGDRLGWLFGEDQARYVVTAPQESAAAITAAAAAAGIPVLVIGRTGGAELTCTGTFAVPLAKLRSAHENWFPDYMARPA
jgi:phosphoribosylformylglycinamidine synthase